VRFANSDGTAVYAFDRNDDGTVRFQQVRVSDGKALERVLPLGYDCVRLARNCYGKTFLPLEILSELRLEVKS